MPSISHLRHVIQLDSQSSAPWSALLIAALTVTSLFSVACGGASEPAPDVDEAQAPVEAVVENPALGIGLDGVQRNGFELIANEGDTLRLRRPPEDEMTEATVDYGAGEPQMAGINLVEAVNNQKADIEARPDGKFFGQVQLMSQLGNAYSTRGRYTNDSGQEIEETRIFAVHPAGDRLLWVTLSYEPNAGAAKLRTDQAMAAFGLIEPLEGGPVDETEPIDGEEAEAAAEAAEEDAA